MTEDPKQWEKEIPDIAAQEGMPPRCVSFDCSRGSGAFYIRYSRHLLHHASGSSAMDFVRSGAERPR
jgi:hypothetical protein